LFVDNFSARQVVATGSSSLDLSNEIIEPLTGRKYEFQLFPFALAELRRKYSKIELNRLLEKRMIFGMYPEIVEKPDEAEALLKSLASSYLYKDVLQYQSKWGLILKIFFDMLYTYLLLVNFELCHRNNRSKFL
jgi:hypothetical protein